MKTVLPRQEFLDALSAAILLAGGRTPKPILNCVKLVLQGDEQLEVMATDGEGSLHLGVSAIAVKRRGQAVVPADRLLGIVRELTDVEITLEVDDNSCIIRGRGSEFHIYTRSVEDFPPVPLFEGEPDLVADGDELRRMISLTLYSAAREASRYATIGVLWEKQGKRLFMVATDGRRLARAGGTLRSANSGDFSAILPTKALSVFEKVFTFAREDEDHSVRMKVMPNQVLLQSGSRVLGTILVEGHFPKYQDVIPRDNNRCARVSREDLLSGVRRAALLTTEESRAVRLSFEKERLILTSKAPEQGDARVELPAQLEGEPLEIGFNPIFLQDALRVMHWEEVFIEMQESFRPGLIRGEDRDEFLYIVMPVSL